MPKLAFRLIRPEDIPLLHRWRNQPHVSDWWDPPYPSYRYAMEEYRHYIQPGSNVSAYIMQIGSQDVGYIQTWCVSDYPDYRPYAQLADETTGIDIFIGEQSYLHRGWGTQLMQAFIQTHVFNTATVPDCIIDPLPTNQAAIRAYEKVGFVHETTFTHDKTDVYLMRLQRQAFFDMFPAPTPTKQTPSTGKTKI